MKRIFEFIPADHDVIVSRTLVMVHQAIDNAFPNANQPSQRFAKTVFSIDEPTLNQPLPGEWSILEDTAPRRPPKSGSDAKLSSKPEGLNKLWKQSVIGGIVILIGAFIAYIVFR